MLSRIARATLTTGTPVGTSRPLAIMSYELRPRSMQRYSSLAGVYARQRPRQTSLNAGDRSPRRGGVLCAGLDDSVSDVLGETGLDVTQHHDEGCQRDHHGDAAINESDEFQRPPISHVLAPPLSPADVTRTPISAFGCNMLLPN